MNQGPEPLLDVTQEEEGGGRVQLAEFGGSGGAETGSWRGR